MPFVGFVNLGVGWVKQGCMESFCKVVTPGDSKCILCGNQATHQLRSKLGRLPPLLVIQLKGYVSASIFT